VARRRQTRDGRYGGPLTHSSYTTLRDTTAAERLYHWVRFPVSISRGCEKNNWAGDHFD